MGWGGGSCCPDLCVRGLGVNARTHAYLPSGDVVGGLGGELRNGEAEETLGTAAVAVLALCCAWHLGLGDGPELNLSRRWGMKAADW